MSHIAGGLEQHGGGPPLNPTSAAAALELSFYTFNFLPI